MDVIDHPAVAAELCIDGECLPTGDDDDPMDAMDDLQDIEHGVMKKQTKKRPRVGDPTFRARVRHRCANTTTVCCH